MAVPDTRQPGGDHYTASEVAMAMIRGDGNMPVPNGIGINCTALKYIPELLEDFELVMDGNKKLFLVLHPNGGGGFDCLLRHSESPRRVIDGQRNLASLVKEAKGRGWNEIIFGGCCKTGPGDIKALGRRSVRSKIGCAKAEWRSPPLDNWHTLPHPGR
ncbi:hypothetical protein BD769DRAFT_276025 [Suillus cothurnatus]|nr:hypothetical protein BD769DRAFT_276025 [Suillus cothurnatus]